MFRDNKTETTTTFTVEYKGCMGFPMILCRKAENRDAEERISLNFNG